MLNSSHSTIRKGWKQPWHPERCAEYGSRGADDVVAFLQLTLRHGLQGYCPSSTQGRVFKVHN